ncbi:unnamed protein product [Caenorhabditis bovis]|uniref:Eukaryotic translation initiation factor 3 subunit H n=1 Tax=Caenorhabditis bovis TaxID=2654633 RepID=A0A8S1F6M3_9PELO|nr:unnamed protein product [Caenorhabditis bovis]
MSLSITALTAPSVKHILLDSLVVMKIVKHVDSELHAGISEVAGESCQGVLTGLVSMEDFRLEITNCFPTARTEPVLDDESSASQQYEEQKQAEMLDMLRKFRTMNIDYEIVGFYQSHQFGACFTQDLVESMFDYQSMGPENVVIVYDPIKTRQGQLSLRAYRLSIQALELSAKNDWSVESVKAAGLTYQNMFEELPIVIKSSYLNNVLMAELALTKGAVSDKYSARHLDLGTKRSLEKSVRAMMTNVDELNKSIQSLTKYTMDKQRHENIVFSMTQKRQAENESRIARGEQPIGMEDIKRIKPPTLQTRNGLLDELMASCDTNALADFCTTVTGENIAKLFMAEAVAEDKVPGSKDRSSSSIPTMILEIPILKDFLSKSTHVYRNHLYDSIDRLHFYITVIILTVFTLLTGAKQHFGNPIDCMLTKEVDDIKSWNDYIHSYCLMHGTYRYNYSNIGYNFPGYTETTTVPYYQWVPFFFAVQVFCFVLPHWIWTWMQKLLYLDMAMIVGYTHDLLSEKDMGAYKNKVTSLISYTYDHFKYRRLHKVGYFAFIFMHPAFACYLYIITKMLFLFNALLQLKIVSSFLGFKNWTWGFDIIYQFSMDRIYGEGPLQMAASENKYQYGAFNQFKHFPILVACDFRTYPSLARIFANNTAQCIIPMNIVNEKLFVFIWIWFILLIGVTFIGTLGWIFKLLDKRTSESMIFQLLKDHGGSDSEDGKPGFRYVGKRNGSDYRYDFVHKFLGADGILLIHFMRGKCGTLQTQIVIDGLYSRFIGDFEKPTKPVFTKKGERGDYSEVNFGVDESQNYPIRKI